MKAHEYQARQLLQSYAIPTSRGEVVFEPQKAPEVFARLANPHCMVKVQILAGGRGKAGGIQKAKTADEARRWADHFIGKPFSTTQSQGQAVTVKAVLLAEDIQIEEEYYLGIVIDRAQNSPVLLFSKQGGVDIEEVAAKNPKAIQKIHFLPSHPPSPDSIFVAIKNFFGDENIPRQISVIGEKLSKLFVEKDASICEINPLVKSVEGRVMALDAKIVFDDNALFRHADIEALKDPEEDDERERKAKEVGLNYVSMSGNIGCLVNGAGLAMATMDMIKLAGGEPANFLDVGGGATADQVREGFKIILQDHRVEAILVNIFGGIMKCDVIAQGIIEASRQIHLKVPLVVRLEGTRVEEGRKLLKESGLTIISCLTIKEAAKAAVERAKEYRKTHAYSCR